MKIRIRNIMVYLYAFVVIYHPNFFSFIGINDFVLLAIFTFCYIFKYMLRRDGKILDLLASKGFVIFSILNILATFYFCLRTLYAGASISNFSGLRIVQGLIPILYLLSIKIINIELDEMNYSKKQKYIFIINVAIMQAVIAISMYLFKPLKNIAISIYYNGEKSSNYFITLNRLHGICNGDYTYSLQILHSILALFSLCFAYFYKERKYYMYSVLILLVTFLNGRTGLLIYIVGVCLFLFFITMKNFNIVKFIMYFICFVFLGLSVVYLIYLFSPNTYSLISHAINDILSFFNGDSGTETGHFLSMFLWPTGFNLLVGHGFRIYGRNGYLFSFYENSDVGFVNDAFMGGFIYMTLLYSSFAYLIKNSIKNVDKHSFEKVFIKVFVICIIIANFKGEVFRSSLLTTSIILFPIFFQSKECEVIQNG